MLEYKKDVHCTVNATYPNIFAFNFDITLFDNVRHSFTGLQHIHTLHIATYRFTLAQVFEHVVSYDKLTFKLAHIQN